jgi:hypothetical protein
VFLLIAQCLLIDLLYLLLHLVNFAPDGGETLLDGVLELVGDHIEVLLLRFLEFVDLVAEHVLAFEFVFEAGDFLLVVAEVLAEVGVLGEGGEAVVAAFLEGGDEVVDVEELVEVEFFVAAEVVLF